MATATITLTDVPNGDVDVVADFGPGGLQFLSPAHQLIVALVRDLQSELGDDADEETPQ